jgi:RNA-directed DNA polymerase
MLTALEQGVKGGKWFSLMDKVYPERCLRVAFARVKANGGSAGVDHQTVEQYADRLEANLAALSGSLQTGSWRPQAIRRKWIAKRGGPRREQRPLGIPTVRDRTVQTALRNALEPIFERDFARHSYGFRPGRGCKDALRRVDHLLKHGHSWVVDADIKSYFDSIPHDRLMALVSQKVADGRVLALIEQFLNQQVMDDAGAWTPPEGTPQGAVLSPLLSNIYLDPLDHLMEEAGHAMVRYADDFVVLCRSEQEARSALAQVDAWMQQAGLTLHPDKTRLVPMRPGEGFDFLGYRFQRTRRDRIRRWPSHKSIRRLRDAIRAKTRRANGHSLSVIIAECNRTLRGWFAYFQHSAPATLARLDGWVRMRLRSILRHRRKRRGRGRGRDHNRWLNAFFAREGLLCMAAAHRAICRPRGRGNHRLESRVREIRMHGSEGGAAG